MRTNIEIEDTYLQAVMDRYGLRTKTEAVELALRHLAGQPVIMEVLAGARSDRQAGIAPALPHAWWHCRRSGKATPAGPAAKCRFL